MPYRSRLRRPKSPLHHSPEALKQAREAAQLKQSALAGAAGISPGFLSELESGQRGASPRTLRRLADVLKIDVRKLERPKTHTCPSCRWPFDLPRGGRIPLHQRPGAVTWCGRGGTLHAQPCEEAA